MAVYSCTHCNHFSATSLATVLRHIGAVHAHDPNFYMQCGIGGCSRTYRNYYSFRKHLRLKHHFVSQEIGSEAPTTCDFQAFQDELDSNGCSPDMQEYGRERSTALFLLKAKEVYHLSQCALNNIVEDISTMMCETLREVEYEVHSKLGPSGAARSEIDGLRSIFSDDKFSQPFRHLKTEHFQRKAYKDIFGLVVSILVHIVCNIACNIFALS